MSAELERVERLVPDLDELIPGFAAAAQGASEAEIEALQVAADRPLPPAYAAFLRAAGQRWGVGDSVLYGARFTVAAMLEFWRDIDWTSPRFVGFGVAEADPYEDLYLDLERPGAELALVRFAEPQAEEEVVDGLPEDLELLDRSFTSLLFVRTWLDHCVPRWPAQRRAQSRRPVGEVDRGDAVLADRGWTRHPSSSTWWRLFQREGAAVLVHEWFTRASLAIEVVAGSARECERINAELAHALGLEVREI
ncbi:hypothetical protein G6O69_24745 [Pseudenhygromyxa sp. WMMC2535]|uniref:hypothetical protein n=1 Tax=Pseudenhygromyxa sp. WMMC2535 TaxID=2712867 RepID=UPI0015572500|nr:hypothetical protein [Pseudenhygromyxa sp. WMMC2535]NVB41071.1 hypothetical protein [Pseudenhygromyxa sp. WMMC2535]